MRAPKGFRCLLSWDHWLAEGAAAPVRVDFERRVSIAPSVDVETDEREWGDRHRERS